MRKAVILTFDQRVDRRILREAESLSAAGYEVTGLAVPRVGAEIDPDPPWLQRAPAQAAATPLRASLPHAVWARFGRPLAGRFRSVRAIGAFGKRMLTRGNVFDPAAYFDAMLYPTARCLAADVYIAHDLPMLPTAVKCAREHGGAAVYDSHELWTEQEFDEHTRACWSVLESKWIGQADAVIAVNASIAEELRRRYALSEVTVVHNADRALPWSPSAPRLFHAAFDLPPEAKVVLFQGGFSLTRNLDTLIAAFRHIADPNIHLVMLGWGEASASLQKTVSRLGLHNRVHFHPKVPQDELLGFTRAADLGVIPYQPICLNNRYCTPNKLFEFIAAGLPILASDLPELRRFVAGFDVGLLGDTSTPEALAALIDGYFADPSLRIRFRANLRRAQDKACWEAEAPCFLHAMDRAIDLRRVRVQAPVSPLIPEMPHVSRP